MWDDEFVNSFIFSPKSLPLVIFTANESFSRLGGNEKVGGKCLNKMKKLFMQVVMLHIKRGAFNIDEPSPKFFSKDY